MAPLGASADTGPYSQDSGSMPRPTTRERRSDSRVGVEEGQCPIQGWIASRFERGRSLIASRFNWDKKVIDRGLRWLNNMKHQLKKSLSNTG